MSQAPFALDVIRRSFRPEYEVLDPLGRGGMAVVFRACQTSLNRMVALKLLDPNLAAAPDFRERFYREAQMASRMSHPGLTTCYDFGHTGGYYYISYQLIEGENLRTALERDGGLPEERAIRIFSTVAATLHYLHEQGVVHRDVKPENILLEQGSELPFVADLGVARDPTGVPLTNAENVLGTPAYVSPEQISGEVPGPASDIYSLGITLHEAITGRHPFPCRTIGDLIRHHLDVLPTFPPEDFGHLGPGWVPLLARMLAKHPGARHRTCAELIGELELVLSATRPPSQARPAVSGEKGLLDRSRTQRLSSTGDAAMGDSPGARCASKRGKARGTPVTRFAYGASILATVLLVAIGLRLAGPPAATLPEPSPVSVPPIVIPGTPAPEAVPRGPPALIPYLEEFCATLRSHPLELRKVPPLRPGAREQHQAWREAVLRGLHSGELKGTSGVLALMVVLDPERVEGVEVRIAGASAGEARTPGRPPVTGKVERDGSLVFEIPPSWIFPGARLLSVPDGDLQVTVRRKERSSVCEAASVSERVPDASPSYSSDPVYHRAMDDQYTTDWRNALATLVELSQHYPSDAHLEANVAELSIAGIRSTPSRFEQQSLDLVATARDGADFDGLLERGVRMTMPVLERHPRDPLLWVHLGTALTMAGFVAEGELCWKLGCLRGPNSYWAWHEKLQNIEDLHDILQANRSDYLRAVKLTRDIRVLLPSGQLRYTQQHEHAMSELQRRANAPVTSPRSPR